MIDIAGVDQIANQRARVGRARQGEEQRQQLLPVLRTGVVGERPPEGQVLREGTPLFKSGGEMQRLHLLECRGFQTGGVLLRYAPKA